MGLGDESQTLTKPQTSAETKNLSWRDYNEVTTLIKLLWARFITSFFVRDMVLIAIRLPEWQPAMSRSNFYPVATMQVIVSVLIERSTLSS